MRGWPGRGLRVITDYVLRPLWRSLEALGAVYMAPVEHYHTLIVDASAPRSRDPFAAFLPGGAVPETAGPPPAHPERLCADVPLSRQERRLAREIWPGGTAGGDVRGG
ncbi:MULTISPECIES: DUF6059 family protein [unclassified Streptomyces]|uniref:DUF6059 family protein n=1 Tax=unclassified Streptomyces TaxID=2593676 RepID=UPI0004C6F573|nr:DUF6059 family protein [Streptomyces sp. NRRL F-5727]